MGSGGLHDFGTRIVPAWIEGMKVVHSIERKRIVDWMSVVIRAMRAI